MATSLGCRVSAISAFCRPTCQTRLHKQLPISLSFTQSHLIAILVPKLVAMATSLSTSGPPSNTWFLRLMRVHNPNGISIGSAVFAHMSAQCACTLCTMGLSFPPSKLPLPIGGSGPHLIHGSLGRPESWTHLRQPRRLPRLFSRQLPQLNFTFDCLFWDLHIFRHVLKQLWNNSKTIPKRFGIVSAFCFTCKSVWNKTLFWICFGIFLELFCVVLFQL